MGDAQLFSGYRAALHVTDHPLPVFLEVPVPQDPALPEETNPGNAEMVALLTALSQVRLHFRLNCREFEEPLSISPMLNRSDRTQASIVCCQVKL